MITRSHDTSTSRRHLLVVLLGYAVILLLLIPGCGTSANISGRSFPLIGRSHVPPRPFGGVQNDLRWLVLDTKFPVNLLFVLDLPFSLVDDFLTLSDINAKTTPYDDTVRIADLQAKRNSLAQTDAKLGNESPQFGHPSGTFPSREQLEAEIALLQKSCNAHNTPTPIAWLLRLIALGCHAHTHRG